MNSGLQRSGFSPVPAGEGVVYFLGGPTACGKTAVAHHLADSFGFEILSADASLVYRGMDIGTAKPSSEELSRYRYHCVDIVNPSETFSAGRWLEAAGKAVRECAERGNPLLAAGGTGLYMKALLEGMDISAASVESRLRWNSVFEKDGTEALRAAAEKMRPGVLSEMPDPDNPRRLIRLLERLEAGEEPFPSAANPSSSAAIPVLSFSPDILCGRIRQRVSVMFDSGFVDEVRSLFASSGGLSETAGGAIGYAEVKSYLDGGMLLEEAVDRTVIRTRQLAKRQRTWYRHQITPLWVDGPESSFDVERAADDVISLWREHGPCKIAGFTDSKQ